MYLRQTPAPELKDPTIQLQGKLPVLWAKFTLVNLSLLSPSIT